MTVWRRSQASSTGDSLISPIDSCPAGRGQLTAYEQAWTLAKDKIGVPLGLSAREQQALTLVADGQDDTAIALIMSISTSTAHAHVERAKRRLGANTRAQAVAMAIKANLI